LARCRSGPAWQQAGQATRRSAGLSAVSMARQPAPARQRWSVVGLAALANPRRHPI